MVDSKGVQGDVITETGSGTCQREISKSRWRQDAAWNLHQRVPLPSAPTIQRPTSFCSLVGAGEEDDSPAVLILPMSSLVRAGHQHFPFPALESLV